jgi:hypothetical protein
MHHRIMACRERESKNEIAGFGQLKRPIPAISNADASEKQNPVQSVRGLFTDDYVGASGNVAVGLGLGAQVLIGGSRRTITLQPLSVEGQIGLNLALGVARLTLR